MEPYGLELILGGGIFALFYFLDVLESRAERRRHWQLIVLSGVFAFVYVYCRSIVALGDGSFLYANGYQLFLSALCIVGYWLLFHLALRWAFYLLSRTNVEPTEKLNYKALWLCSFAILIVCWLPWLFASYPATLCPDSSWQLRQYLGISPWTTHHPPLSTAIMGLCLSLGELLLNRTFGIFIYIVLQSLFGAAVFSYLLITLRKMGCGKAIYIAALLFYAVFPLLPVYAQWFEKDFLYVSFFSLSMILLVSALYEGTCSKRKAFCIALVVSITLLLRNNCKFELLPFFVLLCLMAKKPERKRLTVACVSSVLIFLSVNNLLYPALGIAKGSVAEMLSVPFQQTARYVKYAPEDVSEDEKAVISAVLDYENLASDYMPTLSDPVKENYHGDSESLIEYLKVWFRMGLKHPAIYADAFVHQAYGYLAPVITEGEPPVKYNVDYYENPQLGIFRIASVVPTALMDTIWITMQRLPGIKLLATSGFYSWLVLACAAFLLVKRKYVAALPLIPGIINLLMCVASPMSASIRYDLQVAVTMPLLLWWTALSLSEKEKRIE